MRWLRTLVQQFGYDLVKDKSRDYDRQLVHFLTSHNLDIVIDVGANKGQYATRLRLAGWKKKIISVGPIPRVHEELKKKAIQDDEWLVLEHMALGDQNTQ